MKKLKWRVCDSCSGLGKKRQKKIKKKSIQVCDESSENTNLNIPIFKKCAVCDGKGIVISENFPLADHSKFPHVAIVGLGIAGATLAVACLHRGIPFSIFERDLSFSDRSQGYGLTLQQASKITKCLGISQFENSLISTKHIVFDWEGNVLASWGKRKWITENIKKEAKNSNIHIARQELRLSLLNQLPNEEHVYWNHKLVGISINSEGENILRFLVNDAIKEFKADLVVGADGIRSIVRNNLFKDDFKPLNYLGCLVILGICEIENLKTINPDLFDSETVFQCANGVERIYVMPFSKNKVMWQLSFPINELDAIKLSKMGASALKNEAKKRLNWCSPIPEIINQSPEDLITGYPVYDRATLKNELEICNQNITLIGDAAHPMSPFKGQGANQAMLDALELARDIYFKFKSNSFESTTLRETVLNNFESVMISRSKVKVLDSAKAADFLHSFDVLDKNDQPRRKL